MHHILKTLLFFSLSAPMALMAAEPVIVSAPQTTTVENIAAALPTTQALAEIKADKITVISPRTGMSYTFPNTRPVVLQVQPLTAVTAQTVQRIVASNPALSQESQEQAKQALLSLQ